jgi:hypothetical protein
MLNLRDQTKSTLYYSWTSEERLNQIHCFKNVFVKNCKFPTSYLETFDDHTKINPYDEKVMSFGEFQTNPSNLADSTLGESESSTHTVESNPVYFFVYNFTNYFHFLYDTLPYLYGYYYIKEFHFPTLKLLIADPATQKLYKFNTETFQLLELTEELTTHDSKNLYETLFVSTSLTYGKSYDGKCCANNVYSSDALFPIKLLKKYCSTHCIHNKQIYPKKIYISRRSYIHGDTSNLGTNYTARRKCMNEDEIVELVKKYGFEEVFCECLSMEEKILMFSNAEMVIGYAGGGLTNCVFSPPTTQVVCINTPGFFPINRRFLHVFKHLNSYHNATICSLAPHKLEVPLYTRVKILESNKICEIEGYSDTTPPNYIVKVSNNDVAGFTADAEFPTIELTLSEFEVLDEGINSPFVCDLSLLKSLLEKSFTPHTELNLILHST